MPKRTEQRKNVAATASRPTLNDLREIGKSLRQTCPRGSHAIWNAPAGRPNPLRLLEQSNKGRIADLIPIRYGRMVRTPFTFYRGAALNMAADLAGTPVTGMRVQACGDSHLLNFGAYATPERRVVFDINDLDETLPAPWEWDVKRLAASVVLACRNNGFSEADSRDAVLACVRSYRDRMAEYRLMQSASDIFLGWATGKGGRHFYVRQLRDMKIGAQTEFFSRNFMVEYAEYCGWALARAHARSGAPAQISGYLGKSDAFDKAIAKFANAYADQSERDHAILKKAARSGQVEVVIESDR